MIIVLHFSLFRPILTRFFFFFGSIGAFQPIVDVLRPQSHGVGRAILEMISPTLREVPSAQIRLSTGAVRIDAD